MARALADERETAYVSTGHLPAPEIVQALVNEAQRLFQSNRDGTNSQVYPALARVPSELFGVCVVGTGGQVYGAGEGSSSSPAFRSRGSGSWDCCSALTCCPTASDG
jgi:glutaminase